MKQKPESFFNAIPGVILWIFGIIVLFHIVNSIAGETVRLNLIRNFALANKPASLVLGARPFGGALSFFGHVLLHANWIHLIMNVLFGIIFSIPIVRALGTDLRGSLYFILFFLLSAGGGAIAFFLIEQRNYPITAIGASSAVSGLFAGLAYLTGGWKRVLLWAVMIIIANFIGVLGVATMGEISWQAHMGGFIAGALLMFFYRKKNIL